MSVSNPLGGLYRPLELRGFRNRYSSEISRDFNAISVRSRMQGDVHIRILLQQLQAVRAESDGDIAQIRLRALRLSIITHMRAYYRRVMPPALFASNIRRNCELAQILDYCGTEFRFRRRADLKRVMDCLGLPERCGPFDNGRTLPREACFLYLLRRIALVGRTRELRAFFGGEKSMWSRALRF